jgi:hypothetical protein
MPGPAPEIGRDARSLNDNEPRESAAGKPRGAWEGNAMADQTATTGCATSARMIGGRQHG